MQLTDEQQFAPFSQKENDMLTEAIRLLEQANNYSIRLQMGEDWCVSVDAILAAHSAGAQDEKKSCVVQDECVWPVCRRECVIRDSTHPQPMTDAARDVKLLVELLEDARDYVQAFTKDEADGHIASSLVQQIDAEIERLDRAKGE